MTTLPIETQAALAITVGLIAWIVGALAWEMAEQPWHRWVGRAAIGAGVLQLAAFANFAAGQVEFWQFVQRGDRAHDTGSTAAEFITEGGHTIRVDAGTGRSATGIGDTSAVCPDLRCNGGSGGQGGFGDSTFTGVDGRLRRLHTGQRQESRPLASTSARRRVCQCERCTCSPCLCEELQAAANR